MGNIFGVNECKNYKMDIAIVKGPITSSYYYSDRYDKYILLLADFHTFDRNRIINEKDSIFIDGYLKCLCKEVLSQKNKEVDLYLEIPHDYNSCKKYNEKGDGEKYFTSWVEKVYSVMCKKDSVRLHNCDIRKNIRSGSMYNNIKTSHNYKDVYDNMLKLTADVQERYIKTNKVELRLGEDIILNSIHDTINKLLNGDIEEMYKIQKQYDNISDIEIREKLESVLRISQQNIERLKSFKKYLLAGEFGECMYLSKLFEKLTCSYMDKYLMYRMFRDFGNDTSKYIVVFAGENHIKKYKICLEKLGFVNGFESDKNYGQYVNIPYGIFNLE